MLVKDIKDEDIVNYKKTSMFIIFPNCSFKCDIENKCKLCQNSELVKYPNIDIPVESVVKRYLANPLSHAIVCGGLESFDSWADLLNLVKEFRTVTCDDIVIYTGYYPDEIKGKIEELKSVVVDTNIIIKFGRFIPNKPHRFDEVLGVELSSDNQYAKRLEEC